MDISTRLDFAAPPADVYAMMLDQGFQEEVCVASESISYDVSVDGVERPQPRGRCDSPASAARFTGPQLTDQGGCRLGGRGGDGSRTGT